MSELRDGVSGVGVAKTLVMTAKEEEGGGGWWGFFFNDTATTEIYTLSLHDALPISDPEARCQRERSELKTGCELSVFERHAFGAEDI